MPRSTPVALVPDVRPGWRDQLTERDVVIVSPQPWSDIWVSKHWIASRLARRNRVLFVEPPFWFRGSLSRPGSLIRNSRAFLGRTRKISDNLQVFKPVIWPFRVGPSLADQLRATVKRLGFQNEIVINFTTNCELVSKIDASVRAYYAVDPFPDDAERKICERSDLLIGVSDQYRKKFESYGLEKPISVIPHGYDLTFANEVQRTNLIAEEMRSFKRPVFGFVGSVHDTYVDTNRLCYLANRFPDASFVLIGPYRNNPLGPDLSRQNLNRLRGHSNISLLGPRPFASLLSYVNAFDVCLVLMDTKNGQEKSNTRNRTLFKWLLYISLGKPVVSPRLNDATDYHSIAYFADTDEDFAMCLQEALREVPGDPRIAERLAYASRFDFEIVLDRLSKLIIDFEMSVTQGAANSGSVSSKKTSESTAAE